MNRSLSVFDLVDSLRYSPVLEDDYLLQDGGYGEDEDGFDNHFEHESADDLQLPHLALDSSQSPSAASAGSASSFDDADLPVSGGGDVHLDHDFGHDSDLDSDSESQPPSRASPPSSPRSFPFSLVPSALPSPFPSRGSLFNSDSASELQLDADPRLDSGPDANPGSGFDSDLDLDSGQDPDRDPDQDPDQAGPGSSPSSPNPDPLLDRSRHHLQSNDINDNFGLYPYWHGLPPRAARPAPASLTPDIQPNRRLPAPPIRHHRPHHHHPYRHRHRHHDDHDHRTLALDNSSFRPSRHPTQPDNRPSPPPLANHRQPHLRFDPQPASQSRPPSRNTHAARPRADPTGRDRQSLRPHRQNYAQQQAASVEDQDLQGQHEEDHGYQDDLPLQQHLRLRRARRAARVAREAGRLRPGGGNWGPHRPARRTAAEDPLRPGREDGDQSDSMDHDDELIEVVYEGQAPAPPTPPRRQQRHIRPPRQQRRNNNHNHNHNDGNNQGQDLMAVDLDLELDLDLEQHVPVIDLTEEPDSPVLQRHRPVNILRHNNHNHSHSHNHNHIHIFDDDEEEEGDDGFVLQHLPRNPRRHMAQNGRMPSLNRSDGSILNGNPAAVIDLTLDSPDDNIPANRRLPPPPAAAQLNNQPANRNHNHRRLPAPASPAAAAAAAPAHRAQYQDFGRHLIGSIRGLLPGLLAQAVNNPREADIQFVGAAPAFPMNPNPLAGNPPEFNYQANGFGGYGGRQPTPKPDFQAPPPARPGFTRDTRPDGGDAGAGEDLVVVCPSCDNELKYSPDEEDDNPRPAKKLRGRKNQEEHHFWAVKNCGHELADWEDRDQVYCKNCYDNRKKHSKGKDSAAAKTGFRFQPSETSKSIKIFCAVDDCESEVSPNAAWVGIFM